MGGCDGFALGKWEANENPGLAVARERLRRTVREGVAIRGYVFSRVLLCCPCE